MQRTHGIGRSKKQAQNSITLKIAVHDSKIYNIAVDCERRSIVVCPLHVTVSQGISLPYVSDCPFQLNTSLLVLPAAASRHKGTKKLRNEDM